MAISNETLELINYTKDLEIELNIKIILMLFFIFTSIFLMWYSRNKMDRDTELSNSLFYLFNVASVMTFIFLPMYTFLLLRSVELYIIMYYIFVFYGILTSMAFLYVLWWGGQKFLEKFLGISFKTENKNKYRESFDYRRT